MLARRDPRHLQKHIKEEAFAYCAALKALGYKVFAQAVSITSYDETELLEFIELANSVKPYAVSLVDTYGLLHQSDLIEIVKTMDERLLPEIGLGYHAHNNFQMGYANAIAFLKDRSRRSLVVDATLYGMGKSAGNAPIELLSMHMNSHLGKTYDINQMLEAIQTSVMDVYKKSPWGYNLFYYVAASNKVHPSYVSYLMNKRTLSITEQNEILQQIDEEKNCCTIKIISKGFICGISRENATTRQTLRRCKRGGEEKSFCFWDPVLLS